MDVEGEVVVEVLTAVEDGTALEEEAPSDVLAEDAEVGALVLALDALVLEPPVKSTRQLATLRSSLIAYLIHRSSSRLRHPMCLQKCFQRYFHLCLMYHCRQWHS